MEFGSINLILEDQNIMEIISVLFGRSSSVQTTYKTIAYGNASNYCQSDKGEC